jgi:hypothetical protein
MPLAVAQRRAICSWRKTLKAESNVILAHLLTALAAGGLVGLERSYHGRPAGFRTHTLVCIASSALMLVTVYQQQWFPGTVSQRVSLDPTRMAQGIMTGIGFLGAGVIFKEGLTVRAHDSGFNMDHSSDWYTRRHRFLLSVDRHHHPYLGNTIDI